MRVQVAAVMAALSLLLACSRTTTKSQPTGGEVGKYFFKDLNVSFKPPQGWAEPKSWSLKSKAYAARFDSPDGNASVTLAHAPFAGLNCAAASKAALEAATGAKLEVQNEFELKIQLETFNAGAGSTSSDKREGVARYFCRGKNVIVVEAAANKSAGGKFDSELEATVDSVVYDGEGEQVAVRPPAEPAAPAVFQHTVRFRGQTLGQIAEWYTGSYDNWKKLTRYNEDMSVPNTPLRIGRVVKIPVELVVKKDPLPEPKRARSERRSSSSSAKAAQKQPGEAPAVKEAPSNAGKETDEEEAERTGAPTSAGEEAAPLPPVIGPR